MLRTPRIIKQALASVGSPLASVGNASYDVLALSLASIGAIGPALFEPGIILARFYGLIVRAAPLVATTAFATGAALALQFGQGMERFGGKLYVPNVVAIAIVRALGPVFACLMVAARSGGGIAAELGAMRVTQQIDALRALGADPIVKLVAPMLVALAVGLPLLTFIADIAGILGGMLASAGSLGISPPLYLQKTIDSLVLKDLVVGLVKTSVFGAAIAIIAAYFGLRTREGTSGIGLATTSSIVAANIFVLLADLLATKLLWILRW